MIQSIWGKLGGAGIGLALGGPIGALLGGVAGHMLVDREGALFGKPPRDVMFTMGLVALAAKMAKADGVVVDVEVAAFEQIVDVPESEQDTGATACSNSPCRPPTASRPMPARSAKLSRTSLPCSKTCSTACSTSPRRTRPSTRRNIAYLKRCGDDLRLLDDAISSASRRAMCSAHDDPYLILKADRSHERR